MMRTGVLSGRVMLMVAVAVVAGGQRRYVVAAGEDQRATTPSAQRGSELVHSALIPAFWSLRAYQTAWKQWGLKSRPDDYAAAFRARYGLHVAPYDNGGLPMGFTRPRGLLGLGRGLGNDCLLCHAGKVAGQTIIGLGNTSLDMQSLYEELAAADGLDPVMPLPLCQVRGTNEASNFAVYLMQFRTTELSHRLPLKYTICTNLCEDVPAWWHFRRKKTIYHLGAVDSRSVRTLMPFLLILGNSAQSIKDREPDFAAIRAFLLSIKPPSYPFTIDRQLAERGKSVFERSCARCHGTYGPAGCYPNKLIPMEEIGTDPTLATAFDPEGVEHFLKSWFAREHGPGGEPYHGLGGGGYQAPPLDGIWASAPYFHNGSVPTIAGVLNSADRPRLFTRSFQGDVAEYDPVKLGLRVTVLEKPLGPDASSIERRRVYDTAQPGRSHSGHTFGDKLTPEQRLAVIEYLKTL